MSPFAQIRIHDTTLRDGEQMPGVVFSAGQKMELASRFIGFGADYVELMPEVSAAERSVAKALCKAGFAPKITASTRMRKESVDLALECGLECVTLFTPLSDVQLGTVGLGRDENLAKSLDMVDYALGHGLRVGFAGADATRADKGYVIRFMNAMPKRIEYFMACDTLGCMTPITAYLFFSEVCSRTGVPVCVHGHNDFGLATANTLMGLAAGAEMFSGTFTGIGERAGNAAIEEVVSSLRFLFGVDIPVRYESLTGICDAVERYSGAKLQEHKPIVGRNAFRHESGIHVDGLLKDRRSYEPFDPALVGQKTSFSIGKHSGSGILRHMLGKGIPDEDLRLLLSRIKGQSQMAGRSLSMNDVAGIISREINCKKEGVLHA